jgi:hypothetical protein
MIRDTFEKFSPPERGRFGDNESASVRHPDGTDVTRDTAAVIDFVVHGGSAKAIQVSIDGREVSAVWLPRSQIKVEHQNKLVMGERRDGREIELGTCTITLPLWLAREKGLV